MTETLNTVIQGGALGLLALVLAGAIYLAAAVVPSVKGFFERLTASLVELRTDVAVVKEKVEAGSTAARGAATAALEDARSLREALAAEAFEVRQAIADSERRVTAAIRREQASDPPGPSSTASPARALTPAPGARRLTG